MFAPSSSTVISLPPNRSSRSRREKAGNDASCARTDLGSTEIRPRFSDSSPAKRANMTDQMLNALRDRSFVAMMGPASDLSWFDGPTNIAYAPIATSRLGPEVAKDVTVTLMSAMTQRPSKMSENERFIFCCVSKVLDSMEVPVNKILRNLAPKQSLCSLTLKSQLQGVVEANKLMDDLYWRGWGHRALDLLLFCMFSSCRRFKKIR